MAALAKAEKTETPPAKLKESAKLGLMALTALVVGSMIGSGVFSLPQNMAKGASPGAAFIGWLITGVGMLALVMVFRNLSMRKPDLDAGPYAYARAGFGEFIGFNAAWGYWLSAWLGNVSYAVLVFGTLGHFFPVFGSGNTWQAIVAASVAVWAIHFLILSGVRQAAIVNAVTTLAKLIPIYVFIVIVLVAFNLKTFTLYFWGTGTPALGDILAQVKSTMLVTLWVFIGIEGATVVSARAVKRTDIGRATVIGFVITLATYLMISLLAFGIMSQPQLAALPDTASMASILGKIVGPWGDGFIRLGLLISVFGAYLSWTLFASEIPFRAAEKGTFPAFFGKRNSKGSAVNSLWITNGLIQLFLIVTLFSNSTYTALFYIASTAILVPYVFSGGYAMKLAITGETYTGKGSMAGDLIAGLIATIYGCWLIYAAGPAYLLMCAILYVAGLPFYVMARSGKEEKMFTPFEAALAVGLVIAAVVAAWLMWNGTINPLG